MFSSILVLLPDLLALRNSDIEAKLLLRSLGIRMTTSTAILSPSSKSGDTQQRLLLFSFVILDLLVQLLDLLALLNYSREMRLILLSPAVNEPTCTTTRL